MVDGNPGQQRPRAARGGRGRAAAVGAAITALACSEANEAPMGTLELEVQGLAAGHTLSAQATEPRPLIDLDDEPAAVVRFEDVGNGVHSRRAPAVKYELACGRPAEDPEGYALQPGQAAEGALPDGGRLRLYCVYVQHGTLTVTLVGLDSTIPESWSLVELRRLSPEHESRLTRSQTGEPVRVPPGSYEVRCNDLVGNADTTIFQLTSPPVVSVEITSGQASAVTCEYAAAG
ncbi:MAG: hypothetical protein IT376_01755 [Polyangiaceae bacterium]|nr:hypothetical protein [Polyangiaceae bacterium]